MKQLFSIITFLCFLNSSFAQEELLNADRDFMIATTKMLLKDGVSENKSFIRREFSRIENDEYNFYVDKTYKIESSEVDKLKKYEDEKDVYGDISYEFFWRYVIISKSSAELYEKCKLKKINFIYDISYPDSTSRTIVKTIYTIDGKLPFPFPFTKKEFLFNLK